MGFSSSTERKKKHPVLKDNYAVINDVVFTLANNLVFSLRLQAFLHQISSLTQSVQFVVFSRSPSASRAM